MNMINNNDNNRRIYLELNRLYSQKYEEFNNSNFLYGWTWWSLPSKMWRLAKTLGFENDYYNHEWIYRNTISGYGDYNASMQAQITSLEIMMDKYPDNILIKNISSGGRLD